jgi:hypothetical protein
VKSDRGFHIIKVDDTRPTKLPTLEEARDQLGRGLQQRKVMQYRKVCAKSENRWLIAVFLNKTRHTPGFCFSAIRTIRNCIVLVSASPFFEERTFCRRQPDRCAENRIQPVCGLRMRCKSLHTYPRILFG